MADESTSTTICVRELPDDITRREFRHLVANIPGYQDCNVVSSRDKPPVAFAKFADHDCAAKGLQQLNGYVFDDDLPQRTLQVVMARRELEIRPRSRPANERLPAPQQDWRGPPQHHLPPHGHGMDRPYGQGPPGGYPPHHYGHHQPPPPHHYGGHGGQYDHHRGPPPPHHQQHYGGPPPHHQQPYGQMVREPYAPPRETGRSPQKRSRYDGDHADRQSQDTLCFLKLPRAVTEAMLLDLVSVLPGYVTMNFVANGPNGPVCFALYQDSQHCQAAIASLRGQTVANVPVSVEVARRSLRNDGNGGGVGGSGGGGDRGRGDDHGGGGAATDDSEPPRTCRRMENERSY